jgi:phage head maturation protease
MSNKAKEVKFEAGLDIKRYADEEGKWIIEGIATTADLDVDGLYISEEALIGAQDDLRKYTTLLYNHDRDKEIGKIMEVKYLPEQRALWIKALISKTVPDIWKKVNEEVLNKFSVSGTALDFTEKFIKGLDKTVQYVNQMRLFETSLVTVPADASARTLAFYVEKSMSENKKENSNMAKGKKAEKKIEKGQDEDKKIEKAGEEDGTLARDQKSLDILMSSVTDALGSEDRGVQVDALRSALDFLKALEATDGTGKQDVAKSLTLDDIVKGVDGVFEARFNDIKETVVALSKSTKEAVDADETIKKSAVNEDVNEDGSVKGEDEDEDDEVERSAGEDKEVKEEKKELKIEKSAEKEDEKDTEIAELKRGIADLGKMLKDNLPIRKGLGSESHKEDERGEKSEESDDITRSEKYKEANPFDKLDMFLDQHIPSTKKTESKEE